MKLNLISFTSLLMVFTFMGCSNINKKDCVNTFDLQAVKKIIEEKNKLFTAAHTTGDTAYLNNTFTKDAKVFAPNTDVVIGKKAISKLNEEWLSYGIKEFVEETTALYGNEDFIIDEGTYFLRYGDENIIDKGKYINIWKKENGKWKLSSNIWNTNLPVTSTK